MKKIFTLILVVVAFVFAQAQEMTVPFTSTAVTFDGYIDVDAEPWTNDWIECAVTKSPAQANDGDYTGKFQIYHNVDEILIAVTVNDDSEGTAANSYERDCVEIFFNMDATYKEKAYKDGVWQFRAQRVKDEALNSGKGLGYFDGSGNVASVLCVDPGWADGSKWGTDDSGTEYVWELAFPKAVLAQGVAFDGKNLTFDMQIANGVAGARTGQHFWKNNSDTQWNDATQFTAIALAPATGVEKIATVKGSAYVKNNVLKVKNVNGMVKVYNLAGALVTSAMVEGQASIDISALNAGMYIVKGNNLSAKVIK